MGYLKTEISIIKHIVLTIHGVSSNLSNLSKTGTILMRSVLSLDNPSKKYVKKLHNGVTFIHAKYTN